MGGTTLTHLYRGHEEAGPRQLAVVPALVQAVHAGTVVGLGPQQEALEQARLAGVDWPGALQGAQKR